ncbi:Heat shock protein 75 kDa, mitochondrial [Labeo rohita]|uniref:Heat shock protein 75 kDa, mitochondrial n=1 Tax=Labeo rohita TaxID=84645 RepID=A0ABQ8L4Z8_LABRO|nr:Heat shock protein 75 kDa, mitochondrial [Labeo rohita]
MIRSLNLLRYSLNVSQRTHVRLLSSSRGAGKTITPRHSLEVFIRELISNGSDALEKLRHKMITAGGDTAPMEIHLRQMLPNSPLPSRFFWMLFRIKWRSSSSIIGQFGVGFYSAFMVADKVDVYSQSAEPGVAGYKWSSDG